MCKKKKKKRCRLHLEKFLKAYQNWTSQFVILANGNSTFETIVQPEAKQNKAKQTHLPGKLLKHKSMWLEEGKRRNSSRKLTEKHD